MAQQNRSVSLDLYRLLCMFLITTIHITGYSGLGQSISPQHINFYLVNLLSTLQRFSVAGFVLISAYFLADASGTTKKIITFWLQLIFFSVAIWLLAALFDPTTFSATLAVKSVFPVLSYHFWYPVSYIILLIFSPFLNKILHRFSQKELLCAILVLGFFISVFFHLNPFFDSAPFIGHQSHSLIWFILLYLIAAYIRRYGVRRPILLGPVLFAVCIVLLFLFYIGVQLTPSTSPAYPIVLSFIYRVNLYSYSSVLPMLMAVSSFITFLNLKVPSGKAVTAATAFLAPTVFGIYLIQEHNAVRTMLWAFVDIGRFGNSLLLWPVMLLVFLALWGVSILLTLLYRITRKLFLRHAEAWIFKLLNKISVRISTHSQH